MNEVYLPFKGSKKIKADGTKNQIRKNLVDLIIPNAAGPKILNRLIQSILENLTYTLENGKAGVRIIVISQGIHGSFDLLQDLQARFPTTIFPVYKERNIPPPVPYNDGLEFSASMEPLSEYIMFLDDDMIVQKKGLIELEKEHLNKYGFANVATEHCFFGDKSKLGLNGVTKDFGMGSFFFHRRLFEQVGYLDERFGFHCSDTDFNWRVRLAGKTIAVVPDSQQYMHHDHQQGTFNALGGTHQNIINNDWKLFRKKWHIEGNKEEYQDKFQTQLNKENTAISEIDINHPHHKAILDSCPLGRKRYLKNES